MAARSPPVELELRWQDDPRRGTRSADYWSAPIPAQA
jgi:hypothetical protein